MIKQSVKKPFTILVAVVLVIVLGVISFLRLNTDLLPSMDLPYVLVMTTSPGSSPEKVEMSVTKPLEQALATTSGLENIQSMSMEHQSVIVMEFNQNVNMDSAMIEMNSSIDMVKAYFDDNVSSPMIMKMNPDMLPIQVISVDKDGMDIKQLSHYIKNEIQPYFERIDGVATVNISGLVEDYVDIALNQEKIDNINDKILKAVDKSLYKAKKELDNAKAKITDGKNQLEAQKNEAFNKMAEGSAKLDSAQAQLQSIVASKTKLEAKKKILENALPAVEGISKLKQAKTMIDLAQEKGVTDDMTVTQAIEHLKSLSQENSTDLIIKGFEGLLSSGLFSENETVGQIKNKVNEQIANIENTLRNIGVNEIIIQTGSPEVLNTEISLVNSEIQQTTIMVSQLQNTVAELEKGYIQLEKAKMEAVTAMSVGTSQLETAQIEVDKGVKEFENARDEALKNANIDSLVTQEMISNVMHAQNFSMPAGYIKVGEEKISVKVGEKFTDIDELKNLMLVDMGIDGVEPIYLKDVADVSIKDNAKESFVKVNGNDGIVLSFQKSSVASTSEVSKNISASIKEITQKTQGLNIAKLMDQGDYINMVINSVIANLVYGGIIALLVLIVFLKSIRPTIVIAFSIPLSLLFAIVLMYFSKVTLNMISLAGLALAVGMLVDNSIVVIENIYRLRSLGYSKVRAAVDGTKQVGAAIASSTLTTICVFLPIVFTQGLTRQVFTDMGLTIAYALIASLLVALTFVPCLASNIIGESKDNVPKFTIKIIELYEKALRFNLKHKWIVISLSLGLLVYTLFSATKMPMTFIPSMDSPQMSMTLTMPSDTPDEDFYNAGFSIAEKVQNIQDVNSVAVMQSSGSMMSGGQSKEKILSFYVVLEEDKSLSNTQVAKLIEESLPAYKENLVVSTDNTGISMIAGSGISATIKGNDFDTLAKLSSDVAGVIKSVEGVEAVDDGSGERSEELRIEIDKEKSMKHQLTTAQIYQKVSQALTEKTTTTTFTFDGKDYKGYITSNEEFTKDNIGDIVIGKQTEKNGKESLIKLSDVCTITTAQSPQTINRDNQSRTYTVTATIKEGYNVSLVSREVEKVLKDFKLPEGYYLDLGGENKMIQESMRDMMLMILLAVIFIYLIMVAQFQSLLSPFIVLFTIPLAFTGGLLALQVTNTVLSIVSMIGFLVLAGIVVNNGIVFVDYANQLRMEGMERQEALVKTGKDRLRPILMTALTTILAMSTMAFGVGMGAEMSQGMAIVSIGGLTYATLLTLFLVPALYDILHKKDVKNIEVNFAK